MQRGSSDRGKEVLLCFFNTMSFPYGGSALVGTDPWPSSVAHISWLVSYNMEYIPNDETFYIVFTYATVRGEHYTFTLNIFTYCDCSSMEKNNE